jgi:hypothetical protein
MAATDESGENSTAGGSVGPAPAASSTEVKERFSRWLIFTVLIALLPIFFNGLAVVNRNERLVWKTLLAHGELYLISVAITAAAFGEMVGRESSRRRLARMWLSGLSCALIVVESFLFADTASIARNAEGTINHNSIAWTSITFLLLSVIVGACCVVVSEQKGSRS